MFETLIPLFILALFIIVVIRLMRRTIGHIKANPNTYVILYRKGRKLKEGSGLSFFFYAPNASLVSIPQETIEAPFMFEEVSSDFQQLTVQGQATYRINQPGVLADMMNFTLAADHKTYVSQDPEKLSARVITAVQVQVRNLLETLSLQEVLRGSSELEAGVFNRAAEAQGLTALGIELIDLSILAIKPNPDTARALEAHIREQILKEADDATYARRNAAIAQERSIKENELNTDLAVEAKNLEIRNAQLAAERAELEKRQEIEDQDITGRIGQEERNRQLTELKAKNARTDAQSQAYRVQALVTAVRDVDPKVLRSLMVGQANSSTLIAQAFQDLAEGTDRIGELNVSPELLHTLTKTQPAAASAADDG